MRTFRPLLALPLLALAGGALTVSPPASRLMAQSDGERTSPAAARNHVHSILVLPGKGNVVLLGAHYSLYRSTDGGRSWTALTKQMMLSMALDPRRSSTIYAVSLQRGLVGSTDSGRTWRSIAHGIPSGHVTGVTVDPTGRILLAWGTGLYRSVNGGKSWVHLLGGHSVAAATMGSGGTAYLAAGDGLFVSFDAGRAWRSIPSVGNQPVIGVSAAGKTAYAVTVTGLMRTRNGGRSWSMLNSAPAGMEFIGVSPTDPNEIIGEVNGQGFYASHNGGASWTHAKGIRDTDFNASTVRIAPSTPKVAYTGAWGLYVYATHDGGVHWTRTATLRH